MHRTKPPLNQSSTLRELMQYLQDVVSTSLEGYIWVNAEIADYRPARNGHVYMELVEKDVGTMVAKVKANLWSKERQKLEAKFQNATGETLKPGLKVLLLIRPDLHPIYGLSLHVQDIDPVYSLGEMARQRQETVLRLEKEGLMDKNRSLTLPILPKRLAVVSSATAAGYGDLHMQLGSNTSGFTFFTTLFPAVMQGDATTASVAGALAEIAQQAKEFDAVLIIRGGGSTLDLSSFDAYEIGRAIALCPLPVLTGIGHERDESVADLVAHTRLKTPTAVAEHLVEMMRNAESRLYHLSQSIINLSSNTLGRERNQVERMGIRVIRTGEHVIHTADRQMDKQVNAIGQIGRNMLGRYERRLGSLQTKLLRQGQAIIALHELRINNIAEKVTQLDPDLASKRGFIMVTHEGKWVRNANELNMGDKVKLHFATSELTGTIEEDEKKYK